MPVRSLLHLPLEIATAFFFAASIGIGAGVATISFTRRLSDGLMVTPIAFLAASTAFGFVIWRNYRPAPKLPVRKPRALEVASTR
jgi:hypothetical protein